MTNLDLIAAKRDGLEHSDHEIYTLVSRITSGEMPDYQVAAWLMAAYLHPLSAPETASLTLAMAASGERLDLSSLPKPWVDKHSTGGVGDKTTLVVLPILAACGLTVVKMSGRGLGITGGTIDKLQSVPGFRVDLTPHEMLDQAQRIGIALTGQTASLAPADKVLYALRDVTGTVASAPLIAASILSKKIAGGADTIVLDVKAGSGAFMPSLDKARELAQTLIRVGKLAGLQVRAAITDMDQPLGRACGNAIEVAEAIQTLRDDHGSGFAGLCVDLAALTLHASGKVTDASEANRFAREALNSGRAFQKATEWFTSQGAPADFCVDPDRYLPAAPVIRKVFTHTEGWCKRFDARIIGESVVALGGGRTKKDDAIDLSVGINVHVGVGEEITNNELIATVFARSEADAEAAMNSVRNAIEVSPTFIPAPNLIYEVIS